MTDIAKIAEGLTEAERTAVKDADRSGIIPYIAVTVVLYGIAWLFRYEAAFWFGLGALVSALVFLWEYGRNAPIRYSARIAFLRAHLERER